jgi:hypothetical protein
VAISLVKEVYMSEGPNAALAAIMSTILRFRCRTPASHGPLARIAQMPRVFRGYSLLVFGGGKRAFNI